MSGRRGARRARPRGRGALFSVGDTQAAQGDGEVGGTASESPMDVVLVFLAAASLPGWCVATLGLLAEVVVAIRDGFVLGTAGLMGR